MTVFPNIPAGAVLFTLFSIRRAARRLGIARRYRHTAGRPVRDRL